MTQGAFAMNAVTQNWVPVGRLDEIPVRGARKVVWGDRTIAIFRTADNSVYAIEDACPHKKGPLSQGIVHGECVTCPLHNWVISLKSGEAQGADEGRVASFATRVDATGSVLLSVGDLTPSGAVE